MHSRTEQRRLWDYFLRDSGVGELKIVALGLLALETYRKIRQDSLRFQLDVLSNPINTVAFAELQMCIATTGK